MKKVFLALLTFSVLFLSCKQDKKSMIAKKWIAVSLENPQLDAVIKEQQTFLDTFGRNTTNEQNDSLYGVRNIDSMRQSLQAQLNDFKSMQEHSVKNTWFHFKHNGIVIMNFSGEADSTKWYFDDDGNLMLDEMELKGAGARLKMEVAALSDTVLKLKLNQEGATSTVTFHPEHK